MKRNRLLILSLTALAFLFASGCAPKPSMYYWGNYSTTLYHSKKTPGDEALLAHKQALENIIEQSKAYHLRVPPGVYAELGYFYFRQNNDKLASQYFQMEEATYPKSKILMTRLQQAIVLRKDKSSKKADAAVPAPPADIKKDVTKPETRADTPKDKAEPEVKKNE
jgi:hypothetical protein